MKNINSVVEQINNDRQMTNKRVSEIIAAIFEAEDVDVFEENYIYYRNDGNKEFFVDKSDDDGEGFVLNFCIYGDDDCTDNDIVERVVVTSIQDLYEAIAAICKFAENPYEVVNALSENRII